MHAVLWAYHTMPHSSTQETLYKLVFGVDVIIPIELPESNLRMITMVEEFNKVVRRAELDLQEEDREKVRIKEEATKQQMARKYNKKVCPQEFKKGDLVLRKIELIQKPQEVGKLAPNWKGPYRVIQEIGK